jgi:oligopeptide transport system substrate-binding protein
MAFVTACSGGGNTPPAGETNETPKTTAANGNTAEETPAEPAAEEPAGLSGAEMFSAFASDMPQMFSVQTTDASSGGVFMNIMEGLYFLDKDDQPTLGMASAEEFDEETLTYTFTIRDDAFWTNGEPVTAYDFQFAWDLLFDPAIGAPYAPTWAPLILGANESLGILDANEQPMTLTDEQKTKLTDLGYTRNIGYEAFDDRTLKVTLNFSAPYFKSVTAFYNLLPINQKAYEEIGADKYGTEAEYLVTNGPYTLSKWSHEDEFILDKNETYYGADTIDISKVTYNYMKEQGTRVNAFLAGELSSVGLSGEYIEQVAAQGYDIQNFMDGSVWYWEFNHNQPGLNNVKVRKALRDGVDIQVYINSIRKDKSQEANSLTPPTVKGGAFHAAVGDLVQRPTDGDFSAIKAMLEEGLAEEGIAPQDFTVKLLGGDGETQKSYMEYFQAQWKNNLGIETTIEQMTFQERLDRMRNSDFSIVMAGWLADYDDPMSFLDLWTSTNGNNHGGYADPEYDRIVQEAMFETDEAKRTELLFQLV